MAEYQTDNLVQSVIADGDTGKSLKINPDNSINVVSSDSGGSLSSVYDTTNTEAQILSMGTISPTGAIMSKFTVALKCTHATNGVSYRVTNFFGLLELDTNSGNLNPNQSVIIDINRPLLGVNVYAKNKNTGSNSQITATLIGRVQMLVPANDEVEYVTIKRMIILESSSIFTVETNYGVAKGNRIQVVVVGDNKIKIKNPNNFDIDVTEV